MLMMLACLAHWRRGVAADASDAGLTGNLELEVFSHGWTFMLRSFPPAFHSSVWKQAF